MLNLKRTKNAQIQRTLPVPAGRVAGQVVNLGGSGLRGYLLTAVTAADTAINGVTLMQGGAVGVPLAQATVELIGVHTTLKINFAAPQPRFTKVYVDANDVITTVAAGNTQIGYLLDDLSGGPGVGEVALV